MNHNENAKAELIQRASRSQFAYENVNILKMDATYPEITNLTEKVSERINDRYAHDADAFALHVSQDLLPGAVDDYKYAIANKFPVRPYDTVMQYMVMLNESCVLSTYTDQYQYTGGAHGMMTRSSYSWNLRSGKLIRLSDLFPRAANAARLAIEKIQKEAEARMRENPTALFENYKELIASSFNPDSFYLTPDSVAFYFGEYEIGPYASGIVVFEIPYSQLGIERPDCE